VDYIPLRPGGAGILAQGKTPAGGTLDSSLHARRGEENSRLKRGGPCTCKKGSRNYRVSINHVHETKGKEGEILLKARRRRPSPIRGEKNCAFGGYALSGMEEHDTKPVGKRMIFKPWRRGHCWE